MTENKRFILAEQFNGLQGVTFVKYDCADVDTYYTVDGTVDLLNQLSEENEQLKSDNNRLVNETAKIIGEHQRKVLNLIDRKIDELEKKYKFGQEVAKCCPMHNIRHSINTLKELKKELQE